MKYLLTCLLVLGLSSACWAGEALVKRSQSFYGPCNPLLEEVGICVNQQEQIQENSNLPINKNKDGNWSWDFGEAG